MDWTQIILAIVGLFGVIDLGRIIFFKSSKKQAEGEADSAAVAPLKEANEILRHQLVAANERERELVESNNTLQDKIEKRDENIANLSAKVATIEGLLCIHGGCQLRQPIRGKGRDWYDEHKESSDFGIDCKSCNVLMKEYGERKKTENNNKNNEENGVY